MGEVRPLEEADLPVLADIHLEAIGHVGFTVDEVRRGYIEKLPGVLFARPYLEFASPSLVFEDAGRIEGFVLVSCQPVVFAGERKWLASTTHLMVRPDVRSSFAAVHLLRAVADGPQDAVYVDRSNTEGRMALKAAGFDQIPSQSLRWYMDFERAALMGQQLAIRLNVPWNRVMDGAKRVERAGRNALRRPGPQLPDAPRNTSRARLTIDHVAEVAPKALSGIDLHPDFDDIDHIRHTWNLLTRVRPNSTFISSAVVARNNTVLGWYIVEIDDHGWADVVQMIAVPAHRRTVLIHLLREARAHGAISIQGDMPIDMVYDVGDLGCSITTRDATTSVHSHDPKLLETFHQGRALLTQLEGEFLVLAPATVPR